MKINPKLAATIQEAAAKAAQATAEWILKKVDRDQTVPYLEGNLDNSGHTEATEDGALIVYSTPYAAYQYFTPGLNHYTGQHAAATDHWLDPYLEPAGPAADYFAKALREYKEGDTHV